MMKLENMVPGNMFVILSVWGRFTAEGRDSLASQFRSLISIRLNESMSSFL